MQGHSYFWIGFFVALLSSVPIAVGAWGVLTDQAAQMVFIFIISMATLISGLLIVMYFRKPILERIIGRSLAGVDDISRTSVALLTAVVRGDTEKAIEEAGDLAQTGFAIYTFSGFYRWVIGTCAALVVAFGAFTGTVLLFEQNRKLEEQTMTLKAQNVLFQQQTNQSVEQTRQFGRQNELLSLTLVSQIRQPFADQADVDFNPMVSEIGWWQPDDEQNRCTISFDEGKKLRPQPNRSTISALTKLANSEQIGQSVIEALWFLTEDFDSTVKLGAILALDEMDLLGSDRSFSISNIHSSYLEIQSDIRLFFSSSRVGPIKCDKCETSFRGSVVETLIQGGGELSYSLYVPHSLRMLSMEVSNSLKYAGRWISANEEIHNSIVNLTVSLDAQENQENLKLISKGGRLESSSRRDPNSNVQGCSFLRKLCVENDLLTCDDGQN